MNTPVKDVAPDEMLGYSNEEPMLPAKSDKIPAKAIAQGEGSQLDSDQVDGINAYVSPTPNALIPLDSTGKFPASVIPGNAALMAIVYGDY